MADISALQDALSGVVPDTGFMLDNRSVLDQLQYIEQYARNIPYEPGLTWADYLFMHGNTPEKLAALYEDPSTADGHLPPHQAMLLALLSMQETPRAIMNYFPDAHCDLYYRQLLQLQERPAVPSQVALAVELDSITPELMLSAGTLFSAGQDNQGTAIEFALDDDLLANQSTWSDLRWCLPPESENSAGTSATVYDDERSWPEGGMRLFAATEQDTAILTGWMVASAGLNNDPDHEYHYTLAFSDNITSEGLSASISGGPQWLPLTITPTDGDPTKLVLSLPVNSGEVASPDGLAGAEFLVPVIRLSREDGDGVPAVIAVELSYITDELDSNGDPISSDPISVQYEGFIITPFGHQVDNGTGQGHSVDSLQLFLGISELQAGQTLSLFWKLNSPQPLTLTWQYLAVDNNWQDIGLQLVDGTNSLYRSGLWTVHLPDDASNNAPAMPVGRYWFRAVFPEATTLIDCPWLIGLVANGMTATLMNASTLDSSVLEQPLPAGTIRRPAENISGVSEAEQPWESWGGRPPESSEDFFTRVAQRLSHRNRALTWPDMVMILKTTFPYVFDVMTPSGDILTTVPALTTQQMTVIPVAAEKDNDDPLRPVFNTARLRGMQDFLQALASLWQNIVITNPDYRDVIIEYVVVFRKGVNPSRAEKDLREFLTAQYMPWSTGAAVSVPLANRIDYYEVMATLQQQPYVDHVVSLALDGEEYSVQGEDNQVLILCWPDAV
ncbi:hypothetical protein [Yokenella regensburgei]|uniref:hypothetical protein n=1 Tax=Yokenella regensburgei TaxID=158877 RepID=UPI003ED8DCDC